MKLRQRRDTLGVMNRIVAVVSLVSMTLSACCTMQGCPAAVRWTLGAPLANDTFVITACVDDDCDETTVTFHEDGTSSSSDGMNGAVVVGRVTALPTSISFRPLKTGGQRAKLEVKRNGALVISDTRTLTWTTVIIEGACTPECPVAVVALESEPALPAP